MSSSRKSYVNSATLARRVVSRLEEDGVTWGGEWTLTLVRQVIAVIVESALECLSEGEEVQFGRLGQLVPRFQGEEDQKRPEVEFVSTPYVRDRISELVEMALSLGDEA